MVNNENKNIVTLDFEVNKRSITFLENDPDTSIARMQLLHTGLNRNNVDITKESVIRSIDSFYNKPIIYELNNKMLPSLSNDFKSHKNPKDSLTDRTMLIAGQIPADAKIEFVNDGNLEVLMCDAVMHKRYQPIVLDILKGKNGSTKVSIEMAMEEFHIDPVTHVMVAERFRLMGVCLLGDDITEGIAGSDLEIIKFSNDEYNQSYLSFSHKDDFTIPDNVKMFAQSGLKDIRESNDITPTTSSVSMANFLINNNKADYKKIKSIYEFFEKNESVDGIDATLFGGVCSKEWANEIVQTNDFIVKNSKKEEIKVENEKEIKNKETVIKNKEETVIDNDNGSVVENEEVIENKKEDDVIVENENTEKETKEDSKDEKFEEDEKDTHEDEKDDEDEKHEDDEVEVKDEVSFEELKEENESLKSKNMELEAKVEEMSLAVKKFEREEEMEKQKSLIGEFSHCFEKQEVNAMLDSVVEETFAETEAKVNDGVRRFALTKKSTEDTELEFKQNSVIPVQMFEEHEEDVSATNLKEYLKNNNVVKNNGK